MDRLEGFETHAVLEHDDHGWYVETDPEHHGLAFHLDVAHGLGEAGSYTAEDCAILHVAAHPAEVSHDA